MAKKLVTQVMDWLKDIKGDATGHTPVSTTAESCVWAIKALTRLDKRDSQNRKERKAKK